jgi:hypothetical protein
MQGQKKILWFDAGLKAQSGFTGFYNKAIVDSDLVDFEVSSGYSFGGKLGINKEYNGLALELMFGRTKGKFDHQDFVGTSTLEVNHMDVYVLFRNARNLGFFEIGPKFSFVRSANYFRASPDVPVPLTDITDDFQSGISGVISFGANLIGNEGRFSGQLGLRFEYGFKDIVGTVGRENNAPLRLDGLYSDQYQGTHPIFAGIVFEMNWGLGFYGVSKCGGRKKFFMF